MARRKNDMLAAELALGTLIGADRARAEALLRSDSDFAREVADWAARLAPLAEAVPDTKPPERVWRRIASALDATQGAKTGARSALAGTVAELRRRLAAWRAGALAAAAAAALAGVLWLGDVAPPWKPPLPETRYVAMLKGDSETMGFVITVEPATHRLLIHCLVPNPPDDKAYELWLLKDDGSTPATLGIIGPGEFVVLKMPPKMEMPEKDKRIKLAVSLESSSGAPSANSMGPVMYAGDLVRQIP